LEYGYTPEQAARNTLGVMFALQVSIGVTGLTNRRTPYQQRYG
jgi:hypothetical protein